MNNVFGEEFSIQESEFTQISLADGLPPICDKIIYDRIIFLTPVMNDSAINDSVTKTAPHRFSPNSLFFSPASLKTRRTQSRFSADF